MSNELCPACGGAVRMAAYHGQNAGVEGASLAPGAGTGGQQSDVPGVPGAAQGGHAAVVIDIRTGRGLNSREHWRARARRVKVEREAVAWALIAQKPAKPALPCVVTMTRVAPSNGLDDDNLAGSLKAIRDAVAEWLGLDDRDPRVRWICTQRRGKEYSVEVAFA